MVAKPGLPPCAPAFEVDPGFAPGLDDPLPEPVEGRLPEPVEGGDPDGPCDPVLDDFGALELGLREEDVDLDEVFGAPWAPFDAELDDGLDADGTDGEEGADGLGGRALGMPGLPELGDGKPGKPGLEGPLDAQPPSKITARTQSPRRIANPRRGQLTVWCI